MVYRSIDTEQVYCFQYQMLISNFQASIVECSVYVLVFRTSSNFLCGRRFSNLAKLFGWNDCPYY